MNASMNEFQVTGAMDVMPIGGMIPTGSGGMPGGTMDATAASLAATEMPMGTMLASTAQAMPLGAMGPSAGQEMPAAPAQGSGEQAAGEMPGGAMLGAGSGDMPAGPMLQAPGGTEAWNMDLASPEQSCGCG
jgi:hypothetical protein